MENFLDEILKDESDFRYIRVLSVDVKRPRLSKEMGNKRTQGSISITITLPNKYYSEYHSKEAHFFKLTQQILEKNGLNNYFVIIYDTPISYEENRICANFLDIVYTFFPILIGKVDKNNVAVSVKHEEISYGASASINAQNEGKEDSSEKKTIVNGSIEFQIKLPKFITEWCEQNGFIEKMLSELSQYYIYDLNIKLIASNNESLITDNSNSDSSAVFSTTHSVNDKVRVLGRNIGKHPKYISSVNAPTSESVLAGRITRVFDVREFEKKKNEEKAEQNEEKRVGYIYKFVIDDTTGTIEVCVFCNKENAELAGLQQGRDCIVEGKVSQYNGVFSLNAKNISYCTVNYQKIQKATELLPTPDEYVLIKPFKYNKVTLQDSLLMSNETSDASNEVEYTALAVEEISTEAHPRLIYEIGMVKVKKGVISEYLHLYIKLKPEDARLLGEKSRDVFGGHKLKNVFPDIVKFLSDTSIVGFSNTNSLIDLLNGIGKPLRYGITSPVCDFSSIQKKVPTTTELYSLYDKDFDIGFKRHNALRTALCMASAITKIKFH